MTRKADIIVIGAGPSGSYSAYTAAKLGVKVVICEEHKEVGIPNHCSGHLNVSSLKRLGLQVPYEALENEIKGAVFILPSGNEFRLRSNSPVTYVVNRERFDKYMADLASNAGARYLFKSRVRSLVFDSNYVKGVTLKDGKLDSNIVIDAEGCSSSILKQTGLIGLKSSTIVRGIQTEVDSFEKVDEDMVEIYLGRNVAPNFFAWIIPRKDGTAKVGLATSSGDPNQYLQNFIKKHPIASKKLKNSKKLSLSAHPIPLAGPISKTYSNGFLAVGDAASQVKSTTGGGVIFGLTCAEVAGKVAVEAVESNNFSEQFLSNYEHKWKRLLGFDLRVMHLMRRILNSLSDNRIDKIFNLSKIVGLENVVEKFGDIDFQGRSLLPMIRYPGTLMVIGYFLFSWLTSSTRQ